jgi:type IV secretion system protein VirB1
MSLSALIVSLVFGALGFASQAWAADGDAPLGVPLAGGTPAGTSSFTQLSAACAPEIHLRTVSALVRQESAANPFAININGAGQLARQPANAADAATLARRLLDQGYNIDVGLAQINSGNFLALGYSVEELFDPCANLQAMARILSDCYRRAVSVSGEGQPALHAALSCYNTGSLRNGITNGYVRKVASQVTLPVPELLPVDGVAIPSAPAVRPVAAERKDEARPRNASGEPDAFGASADPDAFVQDLTQPASGLKHQN